MKKMVKALAATLTAVLMMGALISCGDGTKKEPGKKVDLYADAVLIDTMELPISSNWDETCIIPLDFCKRLQVGSKVIFDVDINIDYVKFMVAKGWTDCNVEKYYDKKGKEVPVKENADNAGVYETLDGLEPGTYYFEVTEDNVDLLKGGFGIFGSFKLTKIGMTNLADPIVQEEIELVRPEDKEGFLTFWAQDFAAEKGSVMFIMNYESANLDEAVTLYNVTITYSINDGEEIVKELGNVEIPKNEYGSDYQLKTDLLNEVEIKKNDAVYIKVEAGTTKTELTGDTSILQGNLIDTSSAVGYWKEMCIEEHQKQRISCTLVE